MAEQIEATNVEGEAENPAPDDSSGRDSTAPTTRALREDGTGSPLAAALDERERTLAAAEERLAAREAALNEATERLQIALAAARVGMWSWDLRTGRIEWSAEQYRLFGYKPFSVKPSFGFLCRQCVHPDDLPRGKEEFQTGLRERRAYDTEFRAVWPNGEVHWLQSRGSFVFDASGRAVQMTGVTLDIDRLKQAEQAAQDALEKLNTIAEATPGTIFTFRETRDGQRTFPYATAHLRDTHGIEPEDLARDPSLMFARIHPDDIAAVRASSDESARTMTMWHSRFRHFHPHKGEVWIEAYSSPVREPDGSITWHGIAHDITEVKRAETELLKARAKAEAADRAKSEFLANMSHEIRTPMSAILGYVDILSNRLRDAEALQNLETIRSNGRYLLEIIDDILDLSRIEAGKLSLERRRVSPDRLVLEVQSLMKLRAADKGLRLEVDFEGPLPATIETDATRLRQILINLVENAIKFTDRGEVRIVPRFNRDAARLEIDVIDTGVGIPQATLGRLFRPFTQADSSLTRRFGGSGLGLSICRALARLLGGDVTVASRVGEGSRFRVSIGAGDIEGVPVRPVDRTSLRPVSSPPPARKLRCRVLVVDDRPEMRDLAGQMLEEAGAVVETAVDGHDALERVLRPGGPRLDAILLDMQMPVLDGYAAAAELRRRGFDRAIVALTANAMKEDERKCLACGCDAYLSKPLDRSLLVETIARHTAAPKPRLAAVAPRRARVLVVDDNEDVALMLKLLLEAAGYEVATALDGPAALAAARESAFQAIVLDLGLPGMSGAQIVAELDAQDARAGCRVIGLSGRSLPEEEWRRLGFDHYLQKPAQLDALKAAIGEPHPKRALR